MLNVRKTPLLLATIATLVTAQVQAQSVYWQGGTGNLTDPNYTDGTLTNLAPAPTGAVYFGAGGTGTLSGAQSVEFSRLRIGHNETTDAGTATLTVDGGAVVNLTGGAAGAANAGLTVGNIQNATLVIDGAGTTVTSNRLIVIGIAPDRANRSGTVRITNGGSLIAADGNINIGTAANASNPGMQGHLIVEDGYVGVLGPGADLNIGLRNVTSTFTLSRGLVEVADIVEVATADSTSGNHSTFTINGGSFTNFGHFFVGRGASTNATVNINGGVLNVGARFLMGSGTATGVTANHSAGTLKANSDIRVGDVGDVGVTDSTYNLSGTGVLESNGGGIIGRQGTGRFIQTGGEANFFDVLAIGNREVAANAANGL